MIRLGVIGVGARITSVIYTTMRSLDPEVHVTAFVDPDEKNARSRLAEDDRHTAVRYETLSEMVCKEQLDGLAVGTRCHLHAPYAIQAAQYDLPLFLEKPVAISMEQAIALEEAFTDSRCPVVVSFPLRVAPLCVLTREYIANGAVGTPEHILAVNYVPYGTTYFEHVGYRNYTITQGLFLQKATHDFDYMCYLMDSPITRIAAMASFGHVFGGDKPAGLTCAQCDDARSCKESPQNRRFNCSGGSLNEQHLCLFGKDCGSPEDGMNEDHSSALVTFANGAQGVYTQVFYTRRDAARRGATISGYHGTLDFDWYTNTMRYVRHHRPFSDTVQAGAGQAHFGGDQMLAANFLDVVNGLDKSKTPIETGLQSVYTCLAAKESVASGSFVDVRQVGQVTNKA
ncbi:MAG TPA: Gfo/Idh/MocA family oxidoreductase [Armatimonadota bacterium]|nr:Gfo/Idh/MocA family oxidoreductase [Armatimonadota bacterium]